MLETKLGSEGPSDRNVVVDFLKGLGILLVVMGHCDVGPNVSKLIYSFHMPLFFFLSGIVYKDKICSMKCFFLHKAKGILYPYYVLGFCIILYNTILDLVIRGGDICVLLLKRVIALLYGNFIWENNINYIGTLWFLVALFSVEMIFELLKRKAKNERRLMLFILFITLIGFGNSYVINYFGYINGVVRMRLPYAVDIALCALPFYYLGYLVKFKVSLSAANQKSPCTFLSIGLLLIGMYLSIKVYVFTGVKVDMLYLRFANPILFVVVAFLIIVGLYFVCNSFKMLIMEHLRIVYRLGECSLLIMAIHLYAISYIHRVLEMFSIYNPYVLTGVTLIVSYGIAVLIKRFIPIVYRYPEKI